MEVTGNPVPQRRLSTGEVAASYPPGGIPSTPMEFRQGPHPKKDHLIWKSPPTRQLSQQKRREFELDVTERFYDDYIGPRTTGDSRNEVLTGVQKLGFNPDLYRMNALQGLAHDPSRPVPKHINFHDMIRTERVREQDRVRTQMKQRRLSDTMLHQRPYFDPPGQYGGQSLDPYNQLLKAPPASNSYAQPQRQLPHQLPPMQTTFGDGLNSEIVPGVEKWLSNASQKERDTAAKFIRTISSQGQRDDPATKASTHSSRVRSAVMTPSRQQRMQEKETAQLYKQLERSSKELPQPAYSRKPSVGKGGGGGGGARRLRRSSSDVSNAKGSMFTPTRHMPSHFTVHPEWASEGQH